MGELNLGTFSLQAFAADHSSGALCLRFEFADGVLAYSGDTQMCQGLVDACRDADLAIVECSFCDDEICKGHMNPAGIRQCVERARPKRVVLCHFYPKMAELVEDRQQFEALWEGLDVVPLALADLQELEV